VSVRMLGGRRHDVIHMRVRRGLVFGLALQERLICKLLIRDVFPVSVSSSRNRKVGEVNGPQWLRVPYFICARTVITSFPHELDGHHRTNHHHMFFLYIA
jgi:hypothetical protein